MKKRLLGIRLVLTEALKDNSVRTLAEELDLAVRAPNDCRHALARRIELAYVEDLVLHRRAVNIHEDRFGLSGLCEPLQSVPGLQVQSK